MQLNRLGDALTGMFRLPSLINGGISGLNNAWKLIHTETGEIRELQSKAERDRAYAQKMAKENRQGRSRSFVNGDMRHMHEVYSVLTTPQSGYLMLLHENSIHDLHGNVFHYCDVM